MEPKVWIYVAVFLIYAVRWAIKKAGQNADTPPVSRPSRQPEVSTMDTEKPRHLTFEELLKEITENKQQPQRSNAEAERNKKQKAEDLEEIAQEYESPQRVYREYEISKAQAFNRLSLEETTKLGDTDVKFGKFSAFKIEDNRNVILEGYVRDFQDSDGFKKAFVMSEILKTKF